MRITGRQLRQIIKEEVENMTGDITAMRELEITARRDTLSEDDTAAPVDYVKVLTEKLSTDPDFKSTLKSTLFDLLDAFYRMNKTAFNSAPAGAEAYTLNATVDITDDGIIVNMKDAALNGNKNLKLPNDVGPHRAAGTRVVALADLPMTVTLGYYTTERGSQIGINQFTIKKIGFRPLPKRA